MSVYFFSVYSVYLRVALDFRRLAYDPDVCRWNAVFSLTVKKIKKQLRRTTYLNNTTAQ